MDIWALSVVFHRIFAGMFLFCDDPGYEPRRIVEIWVSYPSHTGRPGRGEACTLTMKERA